MIYTTDLTSMQAMIIAAGGKITKPTFEFHGGRSFHFTDPSGHE